jgi:hypothetical protein
MHADKTTQGMIQASISCFWHATCASSGSNTVGERNKSVKRGINNNGVRKRSTSASSVSKSVWEMSEIVKKESNGNAVSKRIVKRGSNNNGVSKRSKSVSWYCIKDKTQCDISYNKKTIALSVLLMKLAIRASALIPRRRLYTHYHTHMLAHTTNTLQSTIQSFNQHAIP